MSRLDWSGRKEGNSRAHWLGRRLPCRICSKPTFLCDDTGAPLPQGLRRKPTPDAGAPSMTTVAPLAELAGPVLRDLARHSVGDLDRWIEQVTRLRGCAEPIRLTGSRLTVDARTGEILDAYSTATEPHGHLLIPCGNRRASRCPACAGVYRADTFQLIRAGLAGGKGVPAGVRTHPRVLATLTAPSFGPVHRGPGPDGTPVVCHPRRQGLACWRRHEPDDPLIGQPLAPDSYDYVGQVIWNAFAPDLWRRFTIYLRRHLAAAAGMTQAAFNRQIRVSYAKVGEYQRRGVIHFHAVIRLDGRHPDGAVVPPPVWATVELLERAIVSAARAVRLTPNGTEGLILPGGLTWGEQVDVRPITSGELDGGTRLTEQAVAGYIAKYATKATEVSGAPGRRVTRADLARLAAHGVPEHTARLIRTAWRLGNTVAYPQLAGKRLRRWAHMLGFPGHFSTRSRAYSSTLTALRQARAAYRRARQAAALGYDPDTTLVIAHWRFAGQGFTPGESALAEAIAKEEARAPLICPSPQERGPNSDRKEAAKWPTMSGTGSTAFLRRSRFSASAAAPCTS